jgi:hypothetical protein
MLSRVGAQIRKAEGVPRLQELCLGYTASKESRQAMKLPLLLLLATVAGWIRNAWKKFWRDYEDETEEEFWDRQW